MVGAEHRARCYPPAHNKTGVSRRMALGRLAHAPRARGRAPWGSQEAPGRTVSLCWPSHGHSWDFDSWFSGTSRHGACQLVSAEKMNSIKSDSSWASANQVALSQWVVHPLWLCHRKCHPSSRACLYCAMLHPQTPVILRAAPTTSEMTRTYGLSEKHLVGWLLFPC